MSVAVVSFKPTSRAPLPGPLRALRALAGPDHRLAVSVDIPHTWPRISWPGHPSVAVEEYGTLAENFTSDPATSELVANVIRTLRRHEVRVDVQVARARRPAFKPFQRRPKPPADTLASDLAVIAADVESPAPVEELVKVEDDADEAEFAARYAREHPEHAAERAQVEAEAVDPIPPMVIAPCRACVDERTGCATCRARVETRAKARRKRGLTGDGRPWVQGGPGRPPARVAA